MLTLTLDEYLSALRSQSAVLEEIYFICPRCKTYQCGNNLIAAGAGKDFDEVEKYIGFSCIGRFDSSKGCDWTLGGLLQIHKLEVITPDGKRHPRFLPISPPN